MSDAYPAGREVDVILRDGSSVHVRPVREADRAAMAEFFGGLTADSRGFRFFSAAPNVEGEAARAVDVDYADRCGLIAMRGRIRVLSGTAPISASLEASAEVAFAVADELQGHGLGTILLAHLARGGRRAWNRDLRGRSPAAEPPHDRGVPGERLSG